MKTLRTSLFKKILAASLLTSVVLTGTVQADNSLSSLIYEEETNIFAEVKHQNSVPEGILSYSDDANKNSVWSTEYEEYVNPADFQVLDIANTGDANQYIGSNPTAGGKSSGEVFIYNETAGEYHLQ